MPKSTSATKSTKKPNKKPRLIKPYIKWGWLFVSVLVLLWFAIVYASIFAKTDKQAISLMVESGDTYQGLLVADQWQTHPLASKTAARLYLKFAVDKPLYEGAYAIPAGASLQQTVQILQKGAKAAMVRVQIIEGKTTKDLYQTLKSTDGIRLELLAPAKKDYSWADVAQDNKKVTAALGMTVENPEGWFAPDTYFFAQSVSDKTVLQTLYDRQKSLLDRAWQDRAANLPYQSPTELLIMASIVERETGLADERGKVAAVFINRMRQNMRLQTDPTIIYGLFDRYDGKIYRSNIDEKTAYNTYQIDGLPPTPIALPSVKAIAAAAHPEDTDVLYFVATGTGGHTFSRTLDEHNQAVAAYRRVMQEQ